MKIIGLDKKEYKWSLTPKVRATVSKGHNRARIILKTLFPFDVIYEEQTLPGSRSSKNGILTCDFFIPSQQLIIEVQGTQHDHYNSFHYSSKFDFYKAKARDQTKKEWCEINEITLILLPYNESDDEWTNRIKSRRTS